MNLISQDYLMHHGVKGMKWGVRHDKVTDSDIRRKRAELVKQAPKSDGKRRSTSAPPTKGYWKNAPRSQIERLIIDDRKAERKAEKKEQKRVNKVVKNFNRSWYKTYNKASHEFNSRIGSINDKYKKYELGDEFTTKKGQEYVNEVNKMWQTQYKKALKEDYGDDAKLFINNAPFMNQYYDAGYIKKTKK